MSAIGTSRQKIDTIIARCLTLTVNISHDRMQSALPARAHVANDGRVAQRQSSGLLSRWLRVRISPRSQKTPEKQGCVHGQRNEPNLRYANQDRTLRPD